MWENFIDHIDPKICLPNSSLILKCGAQLSDRITKFRTTLKEEMKAMIMIAFTSLNKETVGNVCWRFWSRLKFQIEDNGDFFE